MAYIANRGGKLSSFRDVGDFTENAIEDGERREETRWAEAEEYTQFGDIWDSHEKLLNFQKVVGFLGLLKYPKSQAKSHENGKDPK